MAFPVPEHFIVAAEEALGRTFPRALKARLAISNGGDVATSVNDWILNPVRDASDQKRLSRSANDLVRESYAARQWPRFPSGGIAVASNGSGDLLVLLPGSDDIFHWYHESGKLSLVDVDWD
ncbi:MAG TPA: SMI1/KNR4 family protein [Allosphingosinicella sp.]|nr:SMI1/KNR4 family protein [Allosphingosinicella sp.]